MTKNLKTIWYKVLDKESCPEEGRVTTGTAGHRLLALTRFNGTFSALDNRCPHQGGPLGEGSIENGCLRCPWHGWEFDPITGKSPGGFDDGVEVFPVEERADGLYVGLQESVARQRTISDVLVETMVSCGVDTVFGMVGHSNLGFADAMRQQEERGRLRFFGCRHEGAAAFAAAAYGKLTGRPAACFSIAGPGATNLLTGLWDAKVDRVPILALTGQVDLQVLGPGAFQEVDIASAFQAVAEFSHTVLQTSKYAELMTLAVKNAILKREVAHLILPNEVQETPAAEGASAGSTAGRVTAQEIAPPRLALERAAETVRAAKRPVIIVGHGARFHMAAVIAFAERLNAPVLTTFKGKGLISDRHPLGCGVLGRSGTPIASWFMNESDLLVVFGASFSNHTGITPKRTTVQIDYDPMALGKFHAVDHLLWGEIGTTAALLQEQLVGMAPKTDRRLDIADRRSLWSAEKARRANDDRGQGISSAAVFEALKPVIPETAVIAVDVGSNTYSFGRYFEATHQSVLMSGYLGSIGFGYPAAMGAWTAAPERPAWCITGDGGFGQYLAEVNTAVKYGMNITHVLLNNHELGKISKEQRASGFDVWATSLSNPHFADYVTSCGGRGIRVIHASELEGAFQQAAAYDGPSTVEILTDPQLI